MFSKPLWAKGREEAGHQWYIDETDVKVKGQWCYWYCAMDQEGNLVASRLSQTRAREVAKALLAQTQDVAESPVLVMTDGLHSYPSAIAEVLGPAVKHKPVSCTANRIEQDHRASSNAFR